MKFLVVGLGSMGKRRIRNLQHLGAGTLVGFDPAPQRRAEAEDKYGIATFATYDEAVTAEPDALVISTPPNLHHEYALDAARNGRHAFMEAGVSPLGHDELIKARDGSGVVVAPSCTMRFHPSVRVLRNLVTSGRLGSLSGFTYHSGQWLPDWHPWEDYRQGYFAQRETGACREIVPFELTWLTWVVGEVAAVSAMRGKTTSLEADIDDVYQLLIRTQGGALGHLLVDAVMRVPTRTIRIFGEGGVAEWDMSARAVRHYDPARESWDVIQEPERIQEPGYVSAENMYIDEMRHFVDACAGSVTWMNSLEDDARVLDVLVAAEKESDRFSAP